MTEETNILLEKLTASRHDIGLIMGEVAYADTLHCSDQNKIKELQSVLNGMDTVINDMKDLRAALSEAVASHKVILQLTEVKS